ncbi:hypothetical protein F0562_015849 [Nyssa sinensis]|uniref:Uncharacterized protein n=1 Tax=Nyssa sinensis TaxID=561372 RepID=A0A5J4ZJP8_9ASTE|nr:hypothetical protein F0562_015849 [Nyssa sinensis]
MVKLSAHHKENLICYDDGAHAAHGSEGPGKDDKLPDDTEIIGAVSLTVRDHSCLQVVDPSITTPDDVTTTPGGSSDIDLRQSVARNWSGQFVP